ncbi:MAG: hypothetical protein JW746_10615 [Candidatus Krumholzibacteriota bacterium]|nr:hypothetical protein [Candidatus Krumholzibacteriota bacterium]
MLRDQEKEPDRYKEALFFRQVEGDRPSHIKQKYHDKFRECLGRCADLIADRAGPEHITGILLTGSFSLGEGSILFEGETAVFLSDIDLLVLVDDLDLLLRLLPERERLSVECESLFSGTVFEGRIDVGIVTVSEAGGFSRSPGVFDMSRHSVILQGESSVRDCFPHFSEDQIDGREGIVLLENRIASFLGAWPSSNSLSSRNAHRFFYQNAKSYMDIITGALCLTRRYQPGYEKRLGYVKGESVDEAAGKLLDDKIVSKAESWLAYKMVPTEKILEEQGRDYKKIWLNTAADIVKSWKSFESFLQERDPLQQNGGSVEGLIAGRKSGEWKLDNIRAWKSALEGKTLRDKISIAGSLGSSITRCSPMELLRETGVKLIEHAVTIGTDTVIPEQGGWLLSGAGKWDIAAAELNAKWKKLVFGREG